MTVEYSTIFHADKKDSIDNVAIFSASLEKMLQPLKELSHDGFTYGGKTLYPLLYCYVHDHPEGAKVGFFLP